MGRNRPLSYEEERKLRRLLERRRDVQARRDWAWIRVLLTTGMRISEFAGLTVGEARAAVELGYLHVPAARRKMEACDLDVYLVGEAREGFADLLGLRREAGADDPLVVSRSGGRLTVRAYQLALKGWAEQAHVDGRISPHWLRHAFAVTVVEKCSSENPTFVVARLSRLLGHADPRSCMCYLSMSRSEEGSAAGMVSRAFPARGRMTPARVRREFERRVG